MAFSRNMSLVGYHDLNDEPGFKLAIHRQGDRWFLYTGRLWQPGFHVIEVTDPTAPELVYTFEGFPNTASAQVQAAEGKLILNMETWPAGWGSDPDGPLNEEGLSIWDIETDPAHPRLLGKWAGGGITEVPHANGTHRNFYSGGRYVHATASRAGFYGKHYVVVDIEDPADPQTVGSWWWPGQNREGGEQFSPEDARKERIFLHGAPYVSGDLAFCPWAGAGMVVLDISDTSAPQLRAHLGFNPPFTNAIPVHTVQPFPEREIAIVNGEAVGEKGADPLNMAGIVDISDLDRLRLLSLFPLPEVPDGYPARDFSDRGGRFGPHNQHQFQGHPDLMPLGDLVYMTWFNAGVQVYDISNPRRPVIAGYYIPEDPAKRLGPMPATELITQCEDILVDSRGYIYVTEKNSGLRILRMD